MFTFYTNKSFRYRGSVIQTQKQSYIEYLFTRLCEYRKFCDVSLNELLINEHKKRCARQGCNGEFSVRYMRKS